MRILFLSFLCMFLGITRTTAMDTSPYRCSMSQSPMTPQEKLVAQRQYQLMCGYNGETGYAKFDNKNWIRIIENRRTGKVIVLEPQEDNPNHGNFIKTTLEIHYDGSKYFVCKCHEPSKPVAFVVGSALVGTGLYFLYKHKFMSE